MGFGVSVSLFCFISFLFLNFFVGKGYGAQCCLIGMREELGRLAASSLLSLCRNRNRQFEISPVTVLCLIQRIRGFEDSLRAQLKEHGCATLCSSGSMPRLRAWLLSRFELERIESDCSVELEQACFSWRLVGASEQPFVRKAAERSGLIWRPHTHRLCDASTQGRALFVVWVLNQVFERAPRRLREHVVSYVMSRHWYERPVTLFAPLVDPFAPHRILEYANTRTKSLMFSRAKKTALSHPTALVVGSVVVGAAIAASFYWRYRKEDQ